MPITPFIGVRISWLMFARNSDLTRDDSSASSRAVASCSACSCSCADCRSARRRASLSSAVRSSTRRSTLAYAVSTSAWRRAVPYIATAARRVAAIRKASSKAIHAPCSRVRQGLAVSTP
jgi:hypothetical protein